MRKLAIAAFSFAAGVLAAGYLLTARLALLIGAGLFACGFLALLIKKRDRRRAALLISFGAAFGLLWSFGYGRIFYTPAAALEGQTETVTAVCADYPEPADYGARLSVRVDTPDGRRVKTQLFIFGQAPELSPGDELSFTAEFSPADRVGGEKTAAFTSKGFFLFASLKDGLAITGREDGAGFKYWPQRLAKAVRDKIADIFPEGEAAFMTALLTGSRSGLNEDGILSGALSRTGVSHIVAVSGMHLAFLAGFVMTLVPGKRRAAIAVLPVMAAFAAMVGFTPSVVRAGVMQAFILAAPILRREADPVTSLAFALGLILLVNPYSAQNAGLQLSFGATLGMLILGGRLYGVIDGALERTRAYKRKLVKAPLRFVLASFATTLGATAFTLPISALYFGQVSLIAPLCNLLIIWAVSLAFCMGMAACALGFIYAPLGMAAAYVAAVPAKYICFVVKLLSRARFAAISTASIPFVVWLVFAYLAVISFALLKARPRQLILPGAIGLGSLCAVLVLTVTPVGADAPSVTVLDVGQGQSIVIESGDYTAMVDCGSGSGEDAGAIAADYLIDRGRPELDLLVLTHFHEDHCGGFRTLAERVELGAVAVPEPEAGEASPAREIITLADYYGADIIYVTEDLHISMGDAAIELYAPLGAGDENENGLTALYGEGGFETLITGDINAGLEKQLVEKKALPDIELLIAGHHGSKYSACQELLDAVTPEAAVISVGENSYGHPTAETLGRLRDMGIAVYRTDQLGNITIDAGVSGWQRKNTTIQPTSN